MTYESALSLLSAHGQQHLLRFWNELDEPQRASLLADIASVDLDLIGRIYREQVVDPVQIGTSEKVEPLRGEKLASGGRASLEASGLELLRAGKAAAFLVAGGQGTRLGHDG